MLNRKLAYIAALLFVLAGCGIAPAVDTGTNNTSSAPAHIKALETPAYTGNRGAVIFCLNHLEDKSLNNVMDRIIRVFAEYELPVDVAITVPRNDKEQENLSFLIPYSDAGIIDVNLDGSEISWLDADAPNGENAYATLKSLLIRDFNFLKNYFGSTPSTCFFPYEQFNEHNYGLLQETGFSIISAREAGNFTASRQPVDWSGQVDKKGLYRLPVIVEVSYQGKNPLLETTTATPDENKKILNSIDMSVKGFGLAVVSIQPGSFAGADGKADTAKIQQLANLIKQSSSYGEIVTYNGWLRYAASYIGVQHKPRVMPEYSGGPTVIFRLDDVSKGWYEEADKALIEVFKSNGVPLDCGVISNASGTNSYELPWLKQYHDEGAVGISVHGFDWTYYQLDTTKSGLTYEQIKFKLLKARDSYLNYYAVSPVALTAPTDFYDKTGYQAVEDAGFKIFSTQISVEPHPSTTPVDFNGRKDPGGMYRLPTATDICAWENEKFTGPFDVSKLVKVPDYCKYYRALSSTMTDDNFGYMVCDELGTLNITVLSLHPSAFIDQSGKIDRGKLEKADAIIKWVKTFSTITTFEQWYNYNALKK
jgi:hypothetical protein